MIQPTQADLNRRVISQVRRGAPRYRGEIKRLDKSYVWVLYDHETELYRGQPALRATIRTILKWENDQ